MKVICFYIMSLAIVSSGMAELISNADSERLKGVAATEQSVQLGSVRLRALLQEPERLIDLDQRDYLRKTGRDDRVVVESTLALPKRLFPNVFGDASISNAVTAICLTDGRLFLWERLEGVDVLAMIPLKGVAYKQAEARSLKIWFCATETQTVSEWRQRPDGKAYYLWLQQRMQTLSGSDTQLLGEGSEDDGRVLVESMGRRVTLHMTQRILTAETVIDAKELEDNRCSTSPVAPEFIRMPKIPLLIPRNWPPKQDAAEGE